MAAAPNLFRLKRDETPTDQFNPGLARFVHDRGRVGGVQGHGRKLFSSAEAAALAPDLAYPLHPALHFGGRLWLPGSAGATLDGRAIPWETSRGTLAGACFEQQQTGPVDRSSWPRLGLGMSSAGGGARKFGRPGFHEHRATSGCANLAGAYRAQAARLHTSNS